MSINGAGFSLGRGQKLLNMAATWEMLAVGRARTLAKKR
jgi:hypothetical protein